MKLFYLPISSFLFLNPAPTLGASSSQGQPPRAHELSQDYSFEQYVVDFDKSYEPNTNEYAIKRQNFLRNLEIILNHNKNVVYNLETGAKRNDNHSGHTFHMGVNHLTDLSKEEMQSRFFGYDKSLRASYHTEASATTTISSISERAEVVATSRRLLTIKDHEMDLPFNITDVSTLPLFVKYNKTTPVSSSLLVLFCAC